MITCRRAICLLTLLIFFVSFSRLLSAAYVNLGYLLLIKELSRSEANVYNLYLRNSFLNEDGLGQAERYFERARLLDPHSQVRAWFGLAFIYEITRQSSKAEHTWRGVMRENAPDGRSELARVALGLSYVRRGQILAAREIWAKEPDRIALFLVWQGDRYLPASPEQSLGYYEQAQALVPGDIEIAIRIIWALIRIGQTERALNNLRVLLQQTSLKDFAQRVTKLYAMVDEGFIWIFIAAADIYQQTGEIENAELVLRTAVQVHEAPLTFSPLGTFYCRLGRYWEGIEVLSRAKPYGTQYYALQARQRLSLCYCQAGLIDQALQEAEELAQIAPSDSEFRSWSSFLKENWRQICSH